MGFSCGGTAVIGSPLPLLYCQCAHSLVRCDMGLGPIELILQLGVSCVCRNGDVRDMEMAANNGEAEGRGLCGRCGVRYITKR
jgi:hypothetical protein